MRARRQPRIRHRHFGPAASRSSISFHVSVVAVASRAAAPSRGARARAPARRPDPARRCRRAAARWTTCARCVTVAALMPTHSSCAGSAAVAARTRSQVMTRSARLRVLERRREVARARFERIEVVPQPELGGGGQRELARRRARSARRSRCARSSRGSAAQRSASAVGRPAARGHVRQLVAQRRRASVAARRPARSTRDASATTARGRGSASVPPIALAHLRPWSRSSPAVGLRAQQRDPERADPQRRAGRTPSPRRRRTAPSRTARTSLPAAACGTRRRGWS